MEIRTSGRGERRLKTPSLQELAEEVVAYLAQNDEALADFLAETGLSPADLREAVARDSGRIGLVDHVMADERRLLAFAAHAGRSPETVQAAATGFRRDTWEG